MKTVRTLYLAVATLGLATALAIPASAQDRDWHHDRDDGGWQQNGRWGWAQDRDHDRDDHDRDDRDRDYRRDGRGNSDAYRDGYQDAMRDRNGNHSYHPRGDRWKNDDRRAYESGYRAGYNGQYGNGSYGRGDRDRDWDHDRDHDRDRDNDGRWGGQNRGAWGINGQGSYGRGGYGGNMAARTGYQDGLIYGQRDASNGKGYNATGSGYYENADHGYNSSFGDKNSYRQQYRQAYQQGYSQGYQRNGQYGRRF